MSHFSEALRSTLTRHQIPAYRLGKTAGVAPATIDAYLRGKTLPTRPKISKIIRALPIEERVDLIIARLRDNIPEGWSDNVILRSQPDNAETPADLHAYTANLSPELRSAIEHLTREAIRSQEIRNLIIKLTTTLKRNRSKES